MTQFRISQLWNSLGASQCQYESHGEQRFYAQHELLRSGEPSLRLRTPPRKFTTAPPTRSPRWLRLRLGQRFGGFSCLGLLAFCEQPARGTG